VKRLISTLSIAMALGLCLPLGANADFGFKDLDVRFTNEDGSPAVQAGSHPFAMEVELDFNTHADPQFGVISDEAIKDVITDLPPGFAVDPNPVPRCSNADFEATNIGSQSDCPDSAALGVVEGRAAGDSTGDLAAVYNLAPPPGVPNKLGFHILGVTVIIEGGLRTGGERRLFAVVANQSQAADITGAKLTLWGNPADPAHDKERGNCIFNSDLCPADLTPRPFITLPRSCQGPLATNFAIDSWLHPGALLGPGQPDPSDPNWVRQTVFTHDDAKPTPNPQGMGGCAKLGFNPSITAQPTTKAANSPTGLDFSLDIADEGLTNPSGLAASDIEKTVVTLPEGFSANPSLAEGLEVCTQAQYEAETAFSEPGANCPNAAKVGSVEVETPLLQDELLKGSLYVATPYENQFNSLLALYIVIQSPKLGIVVKQAARVEPDPVTGQLRTISEDMPQLPFSHFRLHFREGARSPLASPPGCGTYSARAVLYPYSGGAPITATSAFQIISGPSSGPCPSGGTPPFKPSLTAGTLNNAAGRFSPFNVRLSRTDSEQEFTNFSIKLPPGIAGILAGVPYCPEAAIAQAKARTGPHGGAEELSNPSCPAASEIGHTLAGAGVGPSLAYAPGKLYLAGPYNGSALSEVAITAAKVGPFDLGTVVVRQALKVDRETAEVFIDATGSDPIPHIIEGIPVHARDIRAYVDRSKFIFNPTSCERTSTASTLLGSGLDFGSAADDRPVTVSTPFQAADCAALRFDPKLRLALRGGTRRGAHPAFRAVLNMNGGPEGTEANIARAQVTLPKSAFLENAHIKTICTRVQFRANQCPAGSVYGFARAYTPVLAEPLQGPVYLRSSEHQLPDLVASLHHEKITVDVVGRIDSLKGRIRNTFEAVPDAPVTKFVLTMQGGKRGLIVNSTDLCKGTHKAIADFTAQNGKVKEFKPAVTARCGGKGKGKRRRAG
jgi:hypothetical protein